MTTSKDPEEDSAIPPSQLVQVADVEHQHPTAASLGEASVPGEEIPTTDEEERYQKERKRKGKTPAKTKAVAKKPRVAQTVVVIREPEQIRQQPTDELTGEECIFEEEYDSEDDVSLVDEAFHVHELERQHMQLVHSPVGMTEYLPWQVELDDGLLDNMMQFDSQKLQDAFDNKDDGSKQVKCKNVLRYPSLDELVARETFLSHMHAVGFGWLLHNEDPCIP